MRLNFSQRRYCCLDVIGHVRRHWDRALARGVFHFRDISPGAADPAPELGAGPAELSAGGA